MTSLQAHESEHGQITLAPESRCGRTDGGPGRRRVGRTDATRRPRRRPTRPPRHLLRRRPRRCSRAGGGRCGCLAGTVRACRMSFFAAGWSSLVARRAHNPKVGGSNPPPATKESAGQSPPSREGSSVSRTSHPTPIPTKSGYVVPCVVRSASCRTGVWELRVYLGRDPVTGKYRADLRRPSTARSRAADRRPPGPRGQVRRGPAGRLRRHLRPAPRPVAGGVRADGPLADDPADLPGADRADHPPPAREGPPHPPDAQAPRRPLRRT